MLVLTVTVPTGPVGTAAATHNCDTLDAAVAFATFTYVNHDKCTNNHVQHAVDDVYEAEGNQTKRQIYQAGLDQRASQEVFGSTYDNYLNDSESVAWMKVEVAVAQAYQNNKTLAEAKSDAREAIQDYYTVKQMNLIENWNATATSMSLLGERALTEANINGNYVYVNIGCGSGCSDEAGLRQKNGSQSMTTVNGTTVNAQLIHADGYGDFTFNYENVDGAVREVYIRGYDANTSQLYITEQGSSSNYTKRWNRIETLTSSLENESAVYTEGVWQALENGSINSSEVLSRNTKMFEYGTETVNGSGNMYDSVAALSTLGLSSPELNGTGSMNVSYNGTTYHGLLLADDAPNSSWNIGSTYNASNIGGSVMLATTGGSLKTLEGEFTLVSATDQSGNQMNETESIGTKKVVYKTADTSSFLNKMETLQDEIREIEERSVGTGGGDSGSSLPVSKEVLAVAALAVIALALARGDRGS